MGIVPRGDAAYPSYRTVIWEVFVLDPNNVAREVVGEKTDFAVSAAAESFGCEYQYCVDDDEIDAGKYYKWYVRLPQSQHRRRGEPVPEVILEIVANLLEVLPEELAENRLWDVGPADYPSYKRAVEDYFRTLYADLLASPWLMNRGPIRAPVVAYCGCVGADLSCWVAVRLTAVSTMSRLQLWLGRCTAGGGEEPRL